MTIQTYTKNGSNEMRQRWRFMNMQNVFGASTCQPQTLWGRTAPNGQVLSTYIQKRRKVCPKVWNLYMGPLLTGHGYAVEAQHVDLLMRSGWRYPCGSGAAGRRSSVQRALVSGFSCGFLGETGIQPPPPASVPAQS